MIHWGRGRYDQKLCGRTRCNCSAARGSQNQIVGFWSIKTGIVKGWSSSHHIRFRIRGLGHIGGGNAHTQVTGTRRSPITRITISG